MIGLSNLDTIRASTFVSQQLQTSSDTFSVPVIGGHSGSTIIPLFSQLNHHALARLDIPYLTNKVQFAGDEVVKVKEGQGSATLAMAYAAASFTNSVLRGMDGEKNIVEPAFIEQDVKGVRFFASLVELGMYGIKKPIPIPMKLTSFEKGLLEKALVTLKDEAQKGIDFVDKEMM